MQASCWAPGRHLSSPIPCQQSTGILLESTGIYFSNVTFNFNLQHLFRTKRKEQVAMWRTQNNLFYFPYLYFVNVAIKSPQKLFSPFFAFFMHNEQRRKPGSCHSNSCSTSQELQETNYEFPTLIGIDFWVVSELP